MHWYFHVTTNIEGKYSNNIVPSVLLKAHIVTTLS